MPRGELHRLTLAGFEIWLWEGAKFHANLVKSGLAAGLLTGLHAVASFVMPATVSANETS